MEERAYHNIFSKVLQMSNDGFIVVDRSGTVIDISESYCDFLGTTRKEAIGYPIFKVIPNSKMVDIMDKEYTENLALHRYVPGYTKNAKDDFVLVSRSFVKNDEGEIVAGVAQVHFMQKAVDVARRMMHEYSELEFYREQYKNSDNNSYSFVSIIGSCKKYKECVSEGIKAANTNFPVLLTGETGTGKEVFAHAIHNASSRAEKPMVCINCAAIPSDLLESELFGYEEGAFTGAKKGGKKGKFQIADGGTVFLDEIGDMPLSMQAKLLRVLQEMKIDVVGSQSSQPIDIRVISATRRDLLQMVREGNFREDLYYRLNVINIEMVPLRSRKSDVKELAEYFLARLIPSASDAFL